MMRLFSAGVRGIALLAIQVLLLLAFCGFVVALAGRLNRRYDFSPQQAYVISEQAKGIAASLTEPTRISFFYDGRESGQRRLIGDVLDQFAAVNPQITYGIFDLDRTPGLAKKYDISSYNTGVIESRGRIEPLPGYDEVDVASVLLKLSRDRARALCFLIGHGEHSPTDLNDRRGYSDVAKALEKESFAIRTFELVPPPKDLADCTAFILAGPARDFFSDEAERLAAFLRSGGNVLLLLEPDSPPSVVQFVQSFGIEPHQDILVNQRNRLLGADAYMVRVPFFDRGTFRKVLDTAAIFPVTRSLLPMEKGPEGVQVDLVAMSDPDTWARVGESQPPDEEPKFRPEIDQPGPFPVAVLAKVQPAEKGGAAGDLAVFGDADFASNFYLNLIGNRDLFMSMVGVLAEDEELVAVRRKALPDGAISPIYLTEHERDVIRTYVLAVLPVLSVLIGGAIAYRRRRKGY